MKEKYFGDKTSTHANPNLTGRQWRTESVCSDYYLTQAVRSERAPVGVNKRTTHLERRHNAAQERHVLPVRAGPWGGAGTDR